jgi:hypothetical protein
MLKENAIFESGGGMAQNIGHGQAGCNEERKTIQL